jgi:hypothetical protein
MTDFKGSHTNKEESGTAKSLNPNAASFVPTFLKKETTENNT